MNITYCLNKWMPFHPGLIEDAEYEFINEVEIPKVITLSECNAESIRLPSGFVIPIPKNGKSRYRNQNTYRTYTNSSTTYDPFDISYTFTMDPFNPIFDKKGAFD